MAHTLGIGIARDLEWKELLKVLSENTSGRCQSRGNALAHPGSEILQETRL